jgi:hypothetical protein
VRGSKRATGNCPENPHPPLTLSLRPLLCPHWSRTRGIRLSQRERAKGEATFQCPARVCAAAHALKEMEPVVIALASDERYFPGLYCAVASALRYLDPTREVDLKVLDGGISQTSGDTFSKLIDRVGEFIRLEDA